jgi:hypothetical protein
MYLYNIRASGHLYANRRREIWQATEQLAAVSALGSFCPDVK